MKIFDTVAQLKLARLTAGQLIETKGYTLAGDGRNGLYLVQTPEEFVDSPDDELDIVLASGNIAKWVSGAGAIPNTIYVSTAGSDTGRTGFNQSEPVQTLQKAIDVYALYASILTEDFTISCATGTYTEGGVIDGLSSSFQLIFDFQDKALSTIDGTAALGNAGLNFNGSGVRGRVKNVTVDNFSQNLIVFQNGATGVIDTCDGDRVNTFGFNASERADMNLIGACDITCAVGGRGLRYYRNSTGSIGDATNPITINGGGLVADGMDIRNGAEVVCNDNVTVDNFANNGITIRNGGFLELRVSTVSNNNVGISVDDLSRLADEGIIYSGNTTDNLYTGFAIKQGLSAHTLIGHDGETGELPTSNYDLIIDNDGVSGIQVLNGGVNFNFDVNKTERITFDPTSNRLRFYGANTELLQVRAPAANQAGCLLLVNDGTTTSIRRVNVGAADSGGTGQRLLTVDN